MSEWISVDDRLPDTSVKKESYEEYNVVCIGPKESIVTTLEFTDIDWIDCNKNNWNEFVKYWMPLPKLP